MLGASRLVTDVRPVSSHLYSNQGSDAACQADRLNDNFVYADVFADKDASRR